ncbi:MAG TPA: hypothetical protein PK781_02385 [Terrimesophilobacter sp.]|nr:hypothetical protein [Terrimesophilobacter sp.]HRP99293.1 hypothetical protein [Terrimesophilobacter sp.]
MSPQRKGWVRIGTDTTSIMLALALVLSVIGAIALAAPVAALARVTSGTEPSWHVAALWTFIVLAVLIGVPLAIFANRPALIDLGTRRLRVGWRTIPLSELRHVYRMPGGTSPDQFVIQLELQRGLDARLPVSSPSLPNLTLEQLEVLLLALQHAPIEPRPGTPVRSPLADELGPRSDTDRIADEVSDALQPFGRVGYAKATLLLELEDAIARRRRVQGEAGSAADQLPSDQLRAAARISGALRSGQAPTITIMPESTAPRVAPTERYGVRRDRAERWLTGEGFVVQRHTPWRVAGWLVIAGFLLAPWIFTIALVRYYFVLGGLPLDVVMGWWVASLLLWPIGVWLGIVLLLRARALRHRDARRAAVSVRSRGVAVPEEVRSFFEVSKPERSYGTQVYMFGLLLSIAFLATGLLFLSLSAGMVGGPYEPLAWHAPLGWLLLVPVIPVFVGVLRWQRYMYGQLARAHVEWRLLGNSSG